jgi:hypothetical protein
MDHAAAGITGSARDHCRSIPVNFKSQIFFGFGLIYRRIRGGIHHQIRPHLLRKKLNLLFVGNIYFRRHRRNDFKVQIKGALLEFESELAASAKEENLHTAFRCV